jgi:hypothetical protein
LSPRYEGDSRSASALYFICVANKLGGNKSSVKLFSLPSSSLNGAQGAMEQYLAALFLFHLVSRVD